VAGAPELYGRLPWLEPGDLSREQREVYDQIVSSRNGMARRASPVTDGRGRLHGPFNAMLFSPAVGAALQELGRALRSRGVLPGRLREAVILDIARIRESSFEWYAHVPPGREAGLTTAELGAIRAGRRAPTMTGAEQLALDLVPALLARRDVADDELRPVLAELGEAGVCELICLVGYYDLLALSLRIWQIPMPEGIPAAWPIS
jgi:alkylhydroperoxidase family enzyme